MNGLTLTNFARDVLLWMSAFSVGTALFTAVLCLRMAKVNPRRYLSFAAAKTGYALVTGTVLVRILLPLQEVIPDVWYVVYLVGLAAAGIGFLGVGRAIRIEYVEWEAETAKEKENEHPREELHQG